MGYHHLRVEPLARELAKAAQAVSALAAELREGAGTVGETGDTAASPFIAAFQQLGSSGTILAARLAEHGNEHRFDRSIREWLDVAQLAVDLLSQASQWDDT
jgi:hypothetical protein